jgi:hypothetical protein
MCSLFHVSSPSQKLISRFSLEVSEVPRPSSPQAPPRPGFGTVYDSMAVSCRCRVRTDGGPHLASIFLPLSRRHNADKTGLMPGFRLGGSNFIRLESNENQDDCETEKSRIHPVPNPWICR